MGAYGSSNGTAALLPEPPRSNHRDGSMAELGSISSNEAIHQPQQALHHHQLPGHAHHIPISASPASIRDGDYQGSSLGMGIGDFERMHEFQIPAQGHSHIPNNILPSNGINSYPDNSFTMMSPPNQGHANSVMNMGANATNGSPSWMALPSPSQSHFQQPQSHHVRSESLPNVRYPVLQPLIHHLGNIIPPSLACDLMDLYFQSSSSTYPQPSSPYVIGHIFRRRSFLHPTSPRVCNPALLASMLWLAAQTSDAAFLTSSPEARGQVCQKLLELTVSLLKPLVHVSTTGDFSSMQRSPRNTTIDGANLSGIGITIPKTVQQSTVAGVEWAAAGASGSVDDVATYMHLATVVSASEYKSTSIRWWQAAWSLARELKLNREMDINKSQHGNLRAGESTEEEKEERRRAWWLLYIMDRHLALCYNGPLALRDNECDGLLLPVDDNIWQSGDIYMGYTNQPRKAGLTVECTSHSIFGFFLPLMTILGQIVDLTHARNHPRLGTHFQRSEDWSQQTSVIHQQLDVYERSLQAFAEKVPTADDTQTNATGMATPAGSNAGRLSETDFQSKMVVSYGTHVLHVLHILLEGKWDPIALFEDNDMWISSQSFRLCTHHAVAAAQAVGEILEYDPDLTFMPFFHDIYLLQGSFILLLIADKLRSDSGQEISKACEIAVTAHEASGFTLNTNYQVGHSSCSI
jgi:xylanolytic transcriptional activator XlnR